MRTQIADTRLDKIRRQKTPYEIYLGGIQLTICKNVYPTGELAELVVECLDHSKHGIKAGDAVLDYGTGTGFLAIQAARRGANVLAIDINPDAIKCAEHNAQRNGVAENIIFRLSHSLSALKPNETFDMVTAGMPWDDAEPTDMLERSVYDPQFEMKKALFNKGRDILNSNGRILITYGETIEARHPIQTFDASYAFTPIIKRLIHDANHYIYLAQPK